ncbi:MAG TPA: hypothetical protein PLQ80_02055 [Candidatus Syntrophosphaera sp.]|nr:hypothetical protein [Candidatus Syntrophosphaera sp.]
MDFTAKRYKHLLATLKDSGYSFVRLDHYLENPDHFDQMKRVVLLRHDVDRNPGQALTMANLEVKLGVFGSYYFRCKPWVFNRRIIKQVADLGHEIGYHYERLADARGDFARARKLMLMDLKRLRELGEVKTAAMHGRPLSQWDNRLIFDKFQLGDFSLIGEPYRSVDHFKYVYVSESGRNWNSDRLVIWDSVRGTSLPHIDGGTRGLASYLASTDLKIQLLLHPNRWSDNMLTWTMQLAGDVVINAAKKMILLGKRIA